MERFGEHARLCCAFDMRDPNMAYRALDFEVVARFGECTRSEDGSILHWNYEWDEGYRELVRCRRCGALLIHQHDERHGFGREDDCMDDWLPVESEEEAVEANRSFARGALQSACATRWLMCTNGTCSYREPTGGIAAPGASVSRSAFAKALPARLPG